MGDPDRASWMSNDFKGPLPINMQIVKASNMRKFHSQDDILGLPMYQRKQISHLPQDGNMMRKYASHDELGAGNKNMLLNNSKEKINSNVSLAKMRPDPLGESKLRFIDEEV